MIALVADCTCDGDGLLDALIAVAAAEAAHGTGHTNAFVPFVTVSKSGVVARIQADCWDLVVADDGSSVDLSVLEYFVALPEKIMG